MCPPETKSLWADNQADRFKDPNHHRGPTPGHPRGASEPNKEETNQIEECEAEVDQKALFSDWKL